MRAVMVKFSSLEADHSLRPPLPLQRGPGWRGSCELTEAGVTKADACDAACTMDRKISGFPEGNRCVPIHLYNRST
jgi:hypothetical protein